jgi:hypothetical protein
MTMDSGLARGRGLRPGFSVRAPFLALALAVALAVVSCGKSSSTSTSATAPILIALTPSFGFVNNVITISGANFGTTQGTSTVTFNNTPASVASWSDTTLVVTVPTGATTGNVVVTVAGVASDGISFAVATVPTITSLSQTIGAVGQPVTINGLNFGTTQGSSTVTVSGANASVTSWSATAIAITVPAGAALGPGNVVVIAGGLGIEHAFDVVVAPAITSLQPNSGAVGATVVINGSNFGAAQNDSTVTFNGASVGTPSVWSDTSITVTVPPAATTGNVVVTFAGVVPSNGSLFTVTSGHLRGSTDFPDAASVSPCGSGSESLLAGEYAYDLQGFLGAGSGSPVARIGSFTADGTGGISFGDASGNGGEEDWNASSGPAHRAIVSGGSAYSIGSDRRGCLTLAYSDGTAATFRFALSGVSSGVASAGSIIEFDDASGAGSRGSGLLLRQNASAFAPGALASGYAFGLDGEDPGGGRVAIAGTFSLDPSTGAIFAGSFDYNDAGNVPFGPTGASDASGNILTGSSVAATGRITASFAASASNGATYGAHWTVYIVDANNLLLMSTDPQTAATPIVSGRAIAADPRGSSSVSSLAGPFVASLTGSAHGDAAVTVVLFTASPVAAAVSGTEWSYSQAASPAASSQPLSGTYSADAASGRVSVVIADGRSLVLYLGNSPATAIAGFALALDDSAASGPLRAQSSATIADGTYALGTAAPADNSATDESGALVLQGGVASGALDQSSASGGLATSEFSALAFTAQPDGSFTAPDGSGGTIVAVPAGTAFLLMDESGPAAIAVVNP